jgi:hypothetical protein
MASLYEKVQTWMSQKARAEPASVDQDVIHHSGMALALDQIAPNELRLLYEHWAARRTKLALPGLADLDMTELGFCSDRLAVAAVEPEPLRVRFKSVGASLIQLCGANPTGRSADELYPATAQAGVMSTYRRVVATGEPLFTRRYFDVVERRFGLYRLMLPLADTGGTVDHVLIGVYPTDASMKRPVEARSVAEILNFWRSAA